MSERAAKTLLLALGNDILGDDGVGFAAARNLETRFAPEVDFILSSEAGLALLELMEGYERALLLDAVVTGRAPVGTVHEFEPDDFREVLAPSPHYAGLPEVLALAERLGIEFPRELRVLALEVEDPYEIREGLTAGVAGALSAFTARAAQILEGWGCTNTA
jgi:hydrogenase maturation protease